MKTAISIKKLTKSYGKARGVNDITIEIEKGLIYGFIGPNGAGKAQRLNV